MDKKSLNNLFRCLVLVGLLSCVTGCLVQYSPQIQTATLQDGVPVYLSDQATLDSSLNRYYQTRDLSSEEGKIDYLLYRVESSNYIFVRNDVEYSGRFSSEFLRWKMGRVREQKRSLVETVGQFIEKVGSKSNMSGKQYLLKSGNQYYYCNEVLQNEWNYVSEFIKRKELLMHSDLNPTAPSQAVSSQEDAISAAGEVKKPEPFPATADVSVSSAVNQNTL